MLSKTGLPWCYSCCIANTYRNTNWYFTFKTICDASTLASRNTTCEWSSIRPYTFFTQILFITYCMMDVSILFYFISSPFLAETYQRMILQAQHCKNNICIYCIMHTCNITRLATKVLVTIYVLYSNRTAEDAFN